MEAVFLKILNMSITATWIALAVVIIRSLLKKAPKALTVVLWGLVGIRLCCPFSFESILSLIPSVETVPSDIMHTDTPVIQSGITILDNTVNPIISNSITPNVGDSVNPMQVIIFTASVIWVIGVALMLIYTLISYIRIQRKVSEAVLVKDNVWVCDNIDTPFILGVIRPRIYLPSIINEQDMEYVIAHEKAHLKRHDHWWKPLGFLLLTIHWFNPVLWIAYVLLCKDIEIACDEKVIKEKGIEVKKLYSEALINCSIPRRTITACPLAFGEVGVKERVKGVLNYKKPAFWIIIVAIAALIVTAVCLLTNPVGTPFYLWGKALDSQKYIDEQQANCLNMANESYEAAGQTTAVPELPKGFTIDKIKDALLEYINYRLWLYPASLSDTHSGFEFDDYIKKSIEVKICIPKDNKDGLVYAKTNIGDWLMMFRNKQGFIYCDGRINKDDEQLPGGIEKCTVLETYTVTIPEPHKPNYGTSPHKEKMIAAFEAYIQEILNDLHNGEENVKEKYREIEVYMADFYEYEGGAHAWFIYEDGSFYLFPVYFTEANGEIDATGLKGFGMENKDEFNKDGKFGFERDIADAVRHYVYTQDKKGFTLKY